MRASARFKLITCFLPSGRGAEVLDRLRAEQAIDSAYCHHARGVGVGSRQGWGRFFSNEREVVTILAPAERADEVFRFVYFAAGLDAPNSGMIFAEPVLRAAPLVLPPLPPADG